MPSTALVLPDADALPERRTFVPNAQQFRLLEAWLDPATPPTIKALAELARVNRRTVYKWLELPEFRNWFVSECRRRFDFASAKMWAKCVELATQGSPDHIKLCAQRLGELHVEAPGLGGDGGRMGITQVFVNVPRPEPASIIDVPPMLRPTETTEQ